MHSWWVIDMKHSHQTFCQAQQNSTWYHLVYVIKEVKVAILCTSFTSICTLLNTFFHPNRNSALARATFLLMPIFPRSVTQYPLLSNIKAGELHYPLVSQRPTELSIHFRMEYNESYNNKQSGISPAYCHVLHGLRAEYPCYL